MNFTMMNKIIKTLFVLILSITVVSCENASKNTPKGLSETTTSCLINDNTKKIIVSKYSFEGHDYQFHTINYCCKYGVGGVIHYPECRKCKNDSI